MFLTLLRWQSPLVHRFTLLRMWGKYYIYAGCAEKDPANVKLVSVPDSAVLIGLIRFTPGSSVVRATQQKRRFSAPSFSRTTYYFPLLRP